MKELSHLKEFEKIGSAIAAKRPVTSSSRAILVGISGIDASGKGYITERLAHSLDWRVAVINVDGWLNLPDVRFNSHPAMDPRLHFFENAIRYDEMFARLILPLKLSRSIDVTTDFTEETAETFRPHRYSFDDVDVILLEGIFLSKRLLTSYYDLKIWIECPFQTALQRAIGRGQEGLQPEETISAYENIYFPAQQIHFERDCPRASADLIFENC